MTRGLTMNNPNHPLYNALGGNANAHLLDNMLFTTDQHKPTLIQQYAYPMDSLAVHQVSNRVPTRCPLLENTLRFFQSCFSKR